MVEVALTAEARQINGSSPSRRLRKEGRIPAVLYGHGIDPISLSVNGRELRSALNTAGVNAIFELSLEGKKHLAFTRHLQRHPVRNTVAHVDFQVVNRTEKITVEVPLEFLGEAEKVTKMGGIVEHQINALEITALALEIPNHLELDISGLELDGALRVSDIKLPRGVVTEIDGNEPVVIGRISRAAAESETEGEAAADAEAPAAAGAAKEEG